jgi:hypothetical protein
VLPEDRQSTALDVRRTAFRENVTFITKSGCSMLGNEETQIFQTFAAAFDTPAFLRRARQTEDAWQALLAHCRQQRTEWLQMPQLRLAQLAAKAQPWPERLSRYCRADDVSYLTTLHADWKPRLRCAVSAAMKEAEIIGALSDLIASFERFNARWRAYLDRMDLEPLNRLREGYNRYYVLEKECALRSSRTANAGFVALPMVGLDDVLLEFPFLNVPQAQVVKPPGIA